MSQKAKITLQSQVHFSTPIKPFPQKNKIYWWRISNKIMKVPNQRCCHVVWLTCAPGNKMRRAGVTGGWHPTHWWALADQMSVWAQHPHQKHLSHWRAQLPRQTPRHWWTPLILQDSILQVHPHPHLHLHTPNHNLPLAISTLIKI